MKTKNNHEKELRSFTCEVRAKENEKNGHYIEGIPIVYDQPTDLGTFTEIIRSGALKDTDLKDVKFLVNHNVDMIPLARSRNNNENSTMQLSEAKEGLKIRVNLDTENNPEAKSLYSAVQRRDIDQMSFAFVIDEEVWTDLKTDHPKREIIKIGKVFEVSAVTFPAYPQTELFARSEDVLENAKKALDSARKQRRNALEIERLRNKIKGDY